jgi:hypothetical protein
MSTTPTGTNPTFDIGHIERCLAAYGIGGNFGVCNFNGEAAKALFGRYTIRADSGIVDMSCSTVLSTSQVGGDRLGIQFGRIYGSFDFGTNPTITSLQGVPLILMGDLNCGETGINNFSGVDKLIQSLHGTISVRGDSTHLLGLLLIPGIRRINIYDHGCATEHILNKYLKIKDILAAQDELIDAGFVEQARL